MLIDAGADVLKWANDHQPKFASTLIGQWIESDAPILQRLAIGGMTGYPSLTPDEKLSWVISNRLIEDFGLKNEIFALLAEVYGASSEKIRAEFLAQAEAAMNPDGRRLRTTMSSSTCFPGFMHTRLECTLVTEEAALDSGNDIRNGRYASIRTSTPGLAVVQYRLSPTAPFLPRKLQR